MSDNTHPLSVNIIENLSNELFYEIFEYLDGWDIYQAFSNLTNRFENLLRHPTLPLKINVSSKLGSLKSYYRQIIEPNKHRIISIKSLNGSSAKSFMKSFAIDSSFDCLQSLTIVGIPTIKFQSFLHQLSSLPCLYALHVNISRDPHPQDAINPYLPILRLPVLKYAKILMNTPQSHFPPGISVEHVSNIEDLSIKNFTLQALINMISYTPQLRRLTCDQLSRSHDNYVPEELQILPNLTHVTVRSCNETFTNMEVFLRKISQLQVLRITASDRTGYLDADRWESLIDTHLPHLRVFKFHFYDFSDYSVQPESHHERLERFRSSFWIERQWFLQFTIDQSFNLPVIIYSIVPDNHKKSIIHSESDPCCATDGFSMQPSRAGQLNYQSSRNFNNDHSYIEDICASFPSMSITTLNIEHYCSQQFFLYIISLLPNLNALNIHSFSTIGSTDKYQTLYQSVLTSNQLTKLVLKKIKQVAQVDFLIDLCPRMKYFDVKYHHDVDLEALVQVILMKDIPQLRTLCLCNDLHDDRTVEKLDAVIERENCTIKRVLDRIYLIWK